MNIDIILEDPRWNELDLETLAARIAKALCQTLEIALGRHEIALLACDDAKIARLNATFRNKTSATNVLSWPHEDLAASNPGQAPRAPRTEELGDIAIAFETCHTEAKSQNKLFENHVTHLIVHGILHLLGYDHETEADAIVMETREIEILQILEIENPYVD